VFRLFLLFLLISLQAFSSQQERSKILKLSFEKKPMRIVLNEIKNESGINFIYNDDIIEGIDVTFGINGGTFEHAVGKLLNKYGIAFRIFEDNSYVLFKPEEAREIKHIYKATLIEQPAPNLDPAVLISKPKLISKMDPGYPPDAVKNNIEGKVNLKLLITNEGDVAKTVIVSSSGSSILDSAAVKHTRILKFIPAEENGKSKSVWVLMIFKYQISGKDNDDSLKK